MGKSIMWSELKRLAGVVVGACIVAFSLNYFVVPNRIVDGGVTGIAILIHYISGLPAGWLVLALNIPVFILGLRKIGKRFLILSIVGVGVLSLAMQLTAGAEPVTQNLLLASIFGGLLTGIGMGIIFRFQGSLGGTDIVALVIKSKFSVNVGQVLLGMDAAIFVLAALLLHKADLAMYATIYSFIGTRVVDYVQEGLSHSKMAIIISNQPDIIANEVMNSLGRGVTFLHGSGAYSGDEKKVIYCVIARTELARLKEIVRNNDPDAFVALSEAPEVLGEGFSPVHGH